jgi:hypothetical protein
VSTTEKPDPSKAALFLADLVIDGEAERLAGLSDEEFLAEQKRRGRDPSRTPSTEEFLGRVKSLAARQEQATPGGALPQVEAKANVRALPKPRRRLLVWLIAAALAAPIVIGLTRGPEIVGHFRDQPDKAARERAEKLRDDATGICEQGAWASCKDKLDEAARLDPAGESEPRVQKARADIQSAERPAPKGPEKPETPEK